MNPRHPTYATSERLDALVRHACQCRCHTKIASTQAPALSLRAADAVSAGEAGPGYRHPGPATNLPDDEPGTDWWFVVVVTTLWLTFVIAAIVAVTT